MKTKAIKAWSEDNIMKMTKQELKDAFGIDDKNPGILLEEEMKLVIEEIRKWSPEVKQAAREHLMKTFQQWRGEAERKLLHLPVESKWIN